MKKILLIFTLLIGFAGYSQVKQTYTQYGGKWKRIQVDSAFKIPMVQVGVKDYNAGYDTAQLYYNPTDSSVYVYTGFAWRALVSGSGSIDSLIWATRARLQQKVDSLGAVINALPTYTFSNGLTESGGVVNLGGALTGETNIDGDGNLFSITNAGTTIAYAQSAYDNATITVLDGQIALWAGTTNKSSIILNEDTIYFYPYKGNIIIDTLNYTLSTTGKKIMLRDTATGLVENIDPALLAGGINIYNSDGTITDNRTVTGNGKALEILGLNNYQLTGSADYASSFYSHTINSYSAELSVINLAASNGRGSIIDVKVDSVVIKPGLGNLRVDSLNYTLSTTGKKIMLRDTATGVVQNIDPALLGGDMTIYTKQQDTVTLASFGAGGGNAGDTTAFGTSTIYGSFYNLGSDTLVITSSCVTLQGSSANITYDIYFNDSLNVTAGANTILSAVNITSTTTAYCTDEGFVTAKIPPGNWVWVKTSTVTTKPTYFTLSLIGYKKRVY